MLNEDNRTVIRKFVQEHIALPPGADALPAIYFRGRVGQNISRSVGVYGGVYVDKHPDAEGLIAAVCNHVVQTWIGSDEPAQVWLLVYPVGEKNPTSGIRIDFDAGRSGSASLDRFAQTRGTSALDSAAAVALLETNVMFRDMLLANMTQNRELVDKCIHYGIEAEISSSRTALLESQATEARMERMFNRLDPHLEKWAPALILGLSTAAAAYGSKGGGAAASLPPADPEQAADWYIQRFGETMFALGAFFAAQPHLLTPPREAKVGQLIAKMMEVAAQGKA